MFIFQKVLHSSRLVSIRQYWWNLFVNGLLMSYLFPVELRRLVLNMLGARIKGVVHGHCTILTSKLILGKGSFFNRNCFIDNNALISVGKNCAIGYKVVLATANHLMGDETCRGGENSPIPIEIQDGCWIGANCTILPGAVIERGCVIAAGSVVKGVCRRNCLYAGVPAKKVRELD